MREKVPLMKYLVHNWSLKYRSINGWEDNWDVGKCFVTGSRGPEMVP